MANNVAKHYGKEGYGMAGAKKPRKALKGGTSARLRVQTPAQRRAAQAARTRKERGLSRASSRAKGRTTAAANRKKPKAVLTYRGKARSK